MMRTLGYAAAVALGVGGPLAAPAYTFQLAMLWLMILLALTWDMVGGQMGYNSLGNIVFFGAGMYLSAVVQIGLYYDVADYTAHFGAVRIDYTPGQYFAGLGLGIVVAAAGAAALALVLGPVLFGLRGPYFAIGTLGVALAAGELVSTSDYLGGGGGITLPVYPGEPDTRALLFNGLCFVLAALVFVVARWLYGTRFGLALNAIRDDEDKAEAMGLRTLRYKLAAWAVSAVFLGAAGAVFGNMAGFIEPREVAFPTITFGIFMVVMALLGGKGTLWGPVLGAALFHVLKEATWTYMLGWQWVALGALIILNIVFFQQGILGWAQERWPARFGIVVDHAHPARRPLATTQPQREGAE